VFNFFILDFFKMKKIRLAEVKGFSSLIVLVGMMLVAVALPLATKLVQQNQENRSNAASLPSCSSASSGKKSCSGSSLAECKCTVTSNGLCVGWAWKVSSCGTNAECIGGKCIKKCLLNKKYYSDGAKTCDGKVKYVCDAGKWSTTPCDCACSSGSCESKKYWYYSGSKCVSTTSYCTPQKCSDAKPGNCFLKEDDCKKANSSSSTSKVSCKSKGGVCIGTVRTCTEVENGKVISGTDCTGSTPVCCKEGQEEPVTKVNISQGSVTIKAGEYLVVSASVDPSNATNKTLSWSSSDSSVASVAYSGDLKGKITGKKEGKATVTAKSKSGKNDTVTVTVVSASKKSCVSGGVERADGAHYCEKVGSHAVEYVCKNGSLTVYEACKETNGVTVGCNSAGTACAVSKSKNGSCSSTYNGKSFTYDKFPSNSPTVLCSSGSVLLTDGVANDDQWNWECRNIGDNGVAISGTGVKCSATKVASTTKNKCEQDGGQCVTSSKGMTSGVTCSLKDGRSGKTDMNGGCTTGYVCCLPGNAKVGQCATYQNVLNFKPDTTCTSGTVAWDDANGVDGEFNWRCVGTEKEAVCKAASNGCKIAKGACYTSVKTCT